MRHGRYATTFILLLALAAPSAALADSGSGDTSAAAEPAAAKPAEATSSKPPVETSTPPVTETKVPEATSTKPPVTTTAPPVTEAPVTTPATTTPATTAPATPSAAIPSAATPTEAPAVPSAPNAPNPTCEGPGCAPDTTDGAPSSPGGGRDLPFTGPGDVVLAIVLAMLAGSGGLLFVAGAAGREQLDALSPRGMKSPSGFQLAYRELRKQQLRD